MDKNIYWINFCGDENVYSAFWSYHLTVNTSNPDLTNCFQLTVLPWIPQLWIIISAVFYIPLVRASDENIVFRSSTRSRNVRVLCIILSLILFLANLSYTLVKQFHKTKNNALPVEYVYLLSQIGISVFLIYLEQWSKRKGIHSPSVIFFYWLIAFLFAMITFRSKIIQYVRGYHVEWFTFVIFYPQVILTTIAFVTCFFPGKPKHACSTSSIAEETSPLLKQPSVNTPEHLNPKLMASFFGILFMGWMNKKAWLGFRRYLTWRDVWEIRQEDACKNVVPGYERAWNKQLLNSNWLPKVKANSRKRCEIKDQGNSESSSQCDDLIKQKLSPSLVWAVFISTKQYLIPCGLLLLLSYAADIANPLILQLLISFIEEPDGYSWKGYMYAVAMSIFTMVSVLAKQHSLYMEIIINMRIRTFLTSTVYKKALKISSASKKCQSVGEIVNLMSVDIEKVQSGFASSHFFSTAPFMIIGITVLLWQYLGPSCLAGIGLMVCLLPVTTAGLGVMMSSFQHKQMIFKDQRLKLVNQILGGIKVLKLYAWEPYFESKIQSLRKNEVRHIQTARLLDGITYVLYLCSTFIVAFVSFAVYTLSDPTHVLDAQTAFVSLSFFNLLNFPLTAIPWAVMQAVQAYVSQKRLSNFILSDEVDPNNVKHCYSTDSVIEVVNGTFSWGEKERQLLKSINLSVPCGKLVAVVGDVGSGKSSLLSAFLGEMMKLTGNVNVVGSVSYVPQQAWIQNMTLKKNILFSKPCLQSKYQKVLNACCLETDLEILPSGDQTEIGEKGINLSGGQKARVSLARAVYQDTDIYLLDDPLAAVDAHVGKKIFQLVLGKNGLLKDKTRILVTHQLKCLPEVDHIIVMTEGSISEQGSYGDLLDHDGTFAEYIRTYLREVSECDVEEQEQVVELQKQISLISSKSDGSQISKCNNDLDSSLSGAARRKRALSSSKKSMSLVDENKLSENKGNVEHQLIKEEVAQFGLIKTGVITSYLKAATYKFTALAFLGVVLATAAQVSTNIWLSEWSGDQLVNGTMDPSLVNLRVGVYGALGMLQCVAILLISVGIALGGMSASQKLHTSLLSNIVKCPMQFFDSTPLGRILNRFSKDIDIIDLNLPERCQNVLSTFAPVIAIITVIAYSMPIFMVVFIPLVAVFCILQRFYVKTSRQLKRLDSIKRSPLYAFFSESLNGVTSIRAYKQQTRFINHLESLLDDSQRIYFESCAVDRWVSVYAQIFSVVIVFFTSFFAVLQRETLDPGLVGLSVTFSLQTSVYLFKCIRFTGELENYIVAVERVKEYIDLENEAPCHTESQKPANTWPEKGIVSFTNFSTQYSPELDPVLKNICFTINSEEKVGIVGRTGAGKSSMVLSMFRIIEATGGAIEIDGHDISQLGLHDVRSKLSIIPQDPVLFSGSLRFNIDPSKSYNDRDIWTAVEHAYLKNFVYCLPEKLEYECGEEGRNLSIGQRQLVCLARALLRKSKILILDEATASVDLETDKLIQATIRTEFKDCTVITIAHRLNTILDYDRVLVLSAGEVKEFESPSKLLEQPNSLFYSMAKDAGLL